MQRILLFSLGIVNTSHILHNGLELYLSGIWYDNMDIPQVLLVAPDGWHVYLENRVATFTPVIGYFVSQAGALVENPVIGVGAFPGYQVAGDAVRANQDDGIFHGVRAGLSPGPLSMGDLIKLRA